jgi:hypothetical protein
MKKMKNIRKHFTAVLAASAMLSAACGEAGISDIINTVAGGGKPPASDEVKLKTLTIYYSDDETKTNLISFNPSKGDYTITDVVNSQGTLTVEAEAQKTAAKTDISWNRVTTKGHGDIAEGLVELTDIPAPGVEGGQNLPTVITITVRNGGESYPYTITAKAPGVDSSLEYLSFRHEEGLTPLSDWVWEDGAGFWNGELLYSKNLTGATYATYTAFDGSSQYVIELPAADKGKAGLNVAITALASDGNSAIELTVNGEKVTPEETPEVLLAVIRDTVGDTDGGLGEDGEELAPAEPVEAVSRRWLVKIPPAGGEALTIALKVANGDVFSAYTITLVPPPDDTDDTDTRLLNIQFKDKPSGNFIINQSSDAGGFNSGTSGYQINVSGFTGPFTIESCAPSYASADVAITYTADGGSPIIIPYPAYDSVEIPKPSADTTTVVKFRVTINDNELTAREYSVTFTNPASSLTWKGSVALDGSGKNDYTIKGLNVITSDNASHTVSVADGKWSIALGKKYADSNNPPVSFTVTLTAANPASGAGNTRYCVVENVSDIKPNSDYTLVFTVDSAAGGGGSDSNPLYTMAYMASDLQNMEANTNYYIANDIDLTKLSGSWDGPDNYKGHFNGGGNTITLQLSKGNSNTGLFDSLKGGAIIENLNVNVSTISGGVAVTESIFFGGLVGGMNGTTEYEGTYTFRNISVKGELNYKSLANGYYLLIGGLMGESHQGLDNLHLIIENCEVDLDISAPVTGTGSNTVVAIGGLIGKMANKSNSSASIKNCRTGGSITLSGPANYLVSAGGLIGVMMFSSGAVITSDGAIAATIQNCYSTMAIDVSKSSQSANTDMIMTTAGGLVGILYNKNAVIENCVALNKSVKATAPAGQIYAGRIVGNLGANADMAPKLSNYALAGMTVETKTGSSAATSNSANGAATVNGEGKDAGFFKAKTGWTGIGFSEDNWDFSNIARDGYPALKKN